MFENSTMTLESIALHLYGYSGSFDFLLERTQGISESTHL